MDTDVLNVSYIKKMFPHASFLKADDEIITIPIQNEYPIKYTQMKNLCVNNQNFYYIVGNEINTSDPDNETGRTVLKIYEYGSENAKNNQDEMIFEVILNEHYHYVYLRNCKVVLNNGKMIYYI